MPDHDANVRYPRRRPRGRLRLCAVALACLSLAVGPGCGVNGRPSSPETSVEVVRGKDSAGASIELEKRGGDLTRGRVIDVVLGTGEAEITTGNDGHIEFTIQFPAGATITYAGTVQNAGISSAQAIAGTWTQHSAGIFGEDTGTWVVATDPI